MRQEHDAPWGKSVFYSKGIKRRFEETEFDFLEDYITKRGFTKVTTEVENGTVVLGFEKPNIWKTIDALCIGFNDPASEIRMSYTGSEQHLYVVKRAIEMVERKYGGQ